MHLVGEATRGGGRRHSPLRVKRKHGNRVVVLDVDARLVALLREPGLPFPLGRLGEAGREDLDPHLPRELLRASANEEHVGSPFHHQAGERDRMCDTLHKRHAACAPIVGHDRGVERDPPLAVRARSQPDRHVGAFALHHAAARLDRVDRGALAQDRQRRPIGRKAVIPGRQDNRLARQGRRRRGAGLHGGRRFAPEGRCAKHPRAKYSRDPLAHWAAMQHHGFVQTRIGGNLHSPTLSAAWAVRPTSTNWANSRFGRRRPMVQVRGVPLVGPE